MKFSPALVAIVLTSATIAVLSPFDIAFAAVTFGSPLLRAVMMAAMALVGAFCAQRVGLRLDGHGARYPVLIGVAMAALMAAYVIAMDAFLFRHLLPADYIEFLESPLSDRLAYFMLRAFNENVIYRLFVFSTLVYLARPCGAAPLLLFAAMVAAQLINIGINVVAASAEALSFLVLAYDALRYVAPGVLWAWLFCRFGFVIAEVASVGCHIFLQPAFSILF